MRVGLGIDSEDDVSSRRGFELHGQAAATRFAIGIHCHVRASRHHVAQAVVIHHVINVVVVHLRIERLDMRGEIAFGEFYIVVLTREL